MQRYWLLFAAQLDSLHACFGLSFVHCHCIVNGRCRRGTPCYPCSSYPIEAKCFSFLCPFLVVCFDFFLSLALNDTFTSCYMKKYSS